jgi:hypothetical protein
VLFSGLLNTAQCYFQCSLDCRHNERATLQWQYTRGDAIVELLIKWEIVRLNSKGRPQKTYGLNSPSVLHLQDYKEGISKVLSDRAACLAALQHYAGRRPSEEASRRKKLLHAIEWYDGRLDQLPIPAALKGEAKILYDANRS